MTKRNEKTGVATDEGLLAQEMARKLFLARESIVELREQFFRDAKDVECAWFHYKWDDILLRGDRNFAVEGFRESGKTQYVIRGNAIHRLAFPSQDCQYIVFILSSQNAASNRLKEIKDEYEDPRNTALSANLVEKKVDNQYAYEVVVLDEMDRKINVRLEAYGKGASVRGLTHRGRRPDLVVIDDPQDLEDAESDTILEKDWRWFLSDIKYLGQHTRIFLIGNNLGEKCILERVFRYADELDFETMRIPILDKNGNSNWPAKYCLEEIYKERDAFVEMGKTDVWYRERMCIAVSPDQQIIKPEWFQTYDPRDISPYQMNTYVTVDPAISEKEGADYSVVCCVGVTKENHWFVLDMDYGRWNPSRLIDSIFQMVATYRPVSVGIEKVAYQAAIEHFVKKEMPKRNIFFEVHPLKAKMKKAQRIQLLQPRFAAGTIWFPQGDPAWLRELKAQLLSLTPTGCKSAHDDLADCLAYAEQIAGPPSSWGNADPFGEPVEIPVAGTM